MMVPVTSCDETQGPQGLSQGVELQDWQGLFMKYDALECIMEYSQGLHVFGIAFEGAYVEKEEDHAF